MNKEEKTKEQEVGVNAATTLLDQSNGSEHVDTKTVKPEKKSGLLRYLTIGIAILSLIIASLSYKTSLESNRIAQRALTSSTNLFLVEKRPYLNINIQELESGNYLDVISKNEPSVTFSLEIKNEGGLPAKDIEIVAYFLDEELNQYERLLISVPEAQKIFPNKSHFITASMSDKSDTVMGKEILSENLMFQVEVRYKSDVGDDTEYLTRKQFSVSTERALLVGGLGEFY